MILPTPPEEILQILQAEDPQTLLEEAPQTLRAEATPTILLVADAHMSNPSITTSSLMPSLKMTSMASMT
jgi:hypothetical protein